MRKISGTIYVMRKAIRILSLPMWFGSLIGCSELTQLLDGIPDDVFQAEPEASGSVLTVGQLADAFVINTASLRRANNKLVTLCVAANRCESEVTYGK